MQKEQAGEGAERWFDTHQGAERTGGKARECNHLPRVRQGRGQNRDADGDQGSRGSAARASMHDADRRDEQAAIITPSAAV